MCVPMIGRGSIRRHRAFSALAIHLKSAAKTSVHMISFWKLEKKSKAKMDDNGKEITTRSSPEAQTIIYARRLFEARQVRSWH
jgi:hypothetical protein